MATDKNTIKSWFEKDDRPTQAQFWAWIDSIWHKDEKIPITAIDDIETILNDKADADAFGNHLTDANAHAELFAEPNARIAALEAKTDSENNWKTITGYSLNPATRVLTMDAGWEGIINGIEYTNVAAQEMLPAIPLANSGYSRIDLIVFKTDGTFERISGVESTFTPVAPPKPAYTLEATFLTVGDGVVNAPVIPKPKAPVTSVNGMRGDVVLAAINDLVTGGIYDFLSAEQGKVLKTQIDNINTLLASDNVNLDNVQELVDAIETVQLSLSTILVNDLTTGGTTKALTAEMGKTLKGLIDGLVVPTATDTVRGIVKTDVPVVDPVVYLKDTVDTLLQAKANYFLGIKPITGISYNVIMGATIEDGDILKQLVYDGTLPMNVIIPNNATVPFPIGTIFYTVGTNTGILSVSGGTGVVFQTSVGLSAAQNEVRKYTKRGVNTWGVEGGVAAVLSSSNYVKNYYVDTTNGNDTTAQEGNINKPFKTIDGAYLFFEQYADFKLNANHILHLMTSGTYYINNAITGYNVVIKSSAKCIISFQNNVNSLVISGGSNLEIDAQWSNLVFSNTIGQRVTCGFLSLNLQEINGGFASDRVLFSTEGFNINVKKMIVNSRVISFSSSSSTVKYMNYFKCPYFIVNAGNTLFAGGGFNYYTIIDLRGYVQTSGHVILFSDIMDGELLLKDVTVSSGDLILGFGTTRMKTVFNNSVISGVAFLDIGSYSNTQHTLTGVLDSTSAPIGGVNYDTTGTLIFENFTGKLHSGFVLGKFNLKVKNSHLTTDGVPFGRNYWVAGKKREFFGANSIYSTNPTVIFSGDYVDTIDFYYPLKTNIPALGTSAVAVNNTTITYP